jgi:hypothetical protein
VANPPEGRRWVKGQSGNPTGYSRSRRISDAIGRLLDKHDALEDVLAQVIVGAAIGEQSLLKGRKPDIRFLQLLIERTEGRAAEAPPPDVSYADIPDDEPDVEPRRPGPAEA